MKVWERLATFSGEDFTILKRTERSFQKRFTIVGAIVLLIFCLCFTSCTYAVYCFFGRNVPLAISIGLFFGWMVTNIYLLLLYTLTPNLLSDVVESVGMMSVSLRIGFIFLLGIVISRPLTVLLFERLLEKNVEQRRIDLVGHHKLSADTLLLAEAKEASKQYQQRLVLLPHSLPAHPTVIQKVLTDSAYVAKALVLSRQIEIESRKPTSTSLLWKLQDELYSLSTKNHMGDLEFLEEMKGFQLNQRPGADNRAASIFSGVVIAIVKNKVSSFEKMTALLENSPFFTYKLKAVTRLYPLSLFIDFGVMLLFLWPLYLKYSERRLERYYAQKRRIERSMVLDEYESFKHNYSSALKGITGLDITFYEPYEDPPFNTRKKSKSLQLKTQEDLLKKLYALD